MIVSVLLHLYQPPQQSALVIDEIIKSCYAPLFKFLKRKKEFKVTLNCPLSLLEWFEKSKHEELISEIKALIDQGRVEVVGSGAYHPLLTKIPLEEAERQIILNESGLAYYFGRKEGFEGESCLMVKNITGFFPPEMAFNNELGQLLNELGYEWALIEGNSLVEDKAHLNRLKGTELTLAVRNTALSLCLAYQRNDDPAPFMEGLDFVRAANQKFVFIALDGETFGHHNKAGLDLLENIVDAALLKGYTFECVGAVVKEYKLKKEVEVKESTWAESEEEIARGIFYPRWYLEGNEVHAAFTKMEKLMIEAINGSSFKPKETPAHLEDALGSLEVWDLNKVSIVSELSAAQKNWLKARMLLDKALNSDKYWWSSNNPDFYPDMIKRSLELFIKSLEKLDDGNEDLVKNMKGLRDEILALVKKANIPE